MDKLAHPSPGYFERWRLLSRPARLYLVHVALLTSSLAVSGLFFNLAILALGYSRGFLGLLHSLSVLVAAALSLPLWWLAARVGVRRALMASAALQATSMYLLVIWPAPGPIFVATAFTGMAAVLFQVSSAPFMMQHSAAAARDHLFSANAAINIGLAGLGSLLAGGLPALAARLLGTSPESGLAYRAAFAVAGLGLTLSLVPLLMVRDAAPQQPATEAGRQRPRLTGLSIAALVQLIPEAWRPLLRRPWPLLRLLIPPFLISCGAALLIPYLNLFFKERFAVPDSLLGVIFAVLGLATGLSALGAPLLSAHIGKIRTVVLTQALSLPFLLMLGFSPLLAVAGLAALARAAFFNMGTPLYDAFAMEQTDERARPLVIGLINGAYSAGYLFAPGISAAVQERYGFAPLFLATAGCYALAVLATYWLFVRGAPGRGERTVSIQRT